MTVMKHIAVAGGGVLGSQIAFQSAFHGYAVTIYDINDVAIDKAGRPLTGLEGRYAPTSGQRKRKRRPRLQGSR